MVLSTAFNPAVSLYISKHSTDGTEEEKIELASEYLMGKVDDIVKANEQHSMIKKNYNTLLQTIEEEIKDAATALEELNKRKALNMEMLTSIDAPTPDETIKSDLCDYYLTTKDFMRAKLVYSPTINLKGVLDKFKQTATLEDGKLQTLLPLFELLKLSGIKSIDKLVLWFLDLKSKQFELAIKECSLNFDFMEIGSVNFLKRFIEWFRIYITELNTSFHIIFSSIEPYHTHYLEWFIHHQISLFIAICKEELVLIKDPTTFHALTLQLMYCGQYLKKYDFRTSLTDFIQSHVILLVSDKFNTAVEYFNDQIERINGLHSKNPIAANLLATLITDKVDELKSQISTGAITEPHHIPPTPIAIRFAEPPPQILSDFPLLAITLNHLLDALNVLYIFPISNLHVQIGELLNSCLLKIATTVNTIYSNNKHYLQDHMTVFIHVMRFDFIPYIIKALVKGIYQDLSQDDYLKDAQVLFHIDVERLFALASK